MSNHEPGSQPVTIFLGNVPVSALNPLPTTGGGGGGGAVTQGAGSGVPTSPWSVRISNGTAFLDPLTDIQLVSDERGREGDHTCVQIPVGNRGTAKSVGENCSEGGDYETAHVAW